jgi:excinuclease ABC subunit A
MNGIKMCGCRENNLKNIDIVIPYSKIIVFTGLSGSGKSSIAYDTLFAEGKRRYIEAIGVHESYFLSKIKKPEADLILGVPPAIALEQNKYIRNPRSTVGTISQINPFIQLLFATCGMIKCESCQKKGKISFIHVNKNRCPICNKTIPSMTPSMFSVNSPNGMCYECGGTGEIVEFDETLIWPNQELSISEGGLKLGGPTKGTTKYKFFNSFLNQFRCTVETPIKEFSNELKVALLYGVKKSKKFKVEFPGIIHSFEKIHKQTKSIDLHDEIESYMVRNVCDVCNGTGLNPKSLAVSINNQDIIDMMSMSIFSLRETLSSLRFEDYRDEIYSQIKKKVVDTLQILINLGVGYLSLSRKVNTLSGGEMQRIRLGAQISSQISGVVYILDEPSIGMHHCDIYRLINTIKQLKDIGNKNTIVLVEHDLSIMKEADYIFEIGPGAGNLGGKIIAQGTPSEIVNNSKSLTAKYIAGRAIAATPNLKKHHDFVDHIEIDNANAHNLKNVHVKIPLHSLIGITGVSGSGKSSLIFDSFYNIINPQKGSKKTDITTQIKGIKKVDRIVASDQSPIGKSSRSNPATYSKSYSLIRNLFAKTSDAKKKKYDQSHFSFNSEKGRCEECKGKGYIQVEMSFMPELYIPCENCGRKRFKKEILNVQYSGKNISEILDMTIDEALEFFEDQKQITAKLLPISEVGLGYVRLGQETATLSGGESQRLKLASELTNGKTNNTLFIFDEPSTGLHFEDIKRLLGVFKKLLSQGNSIILIEHNLDIVASCDYIIDIGPGAGERGGRVVGVGTPFEISEFETPTGIALCQFFEEITFE